MIDKFMQTLSADHTFNKMRMRPNYLKEIESSLIFILGIDYDWSMIWWINLNHFWKMMIKRWYFGDEMKRKQYLYMINIINLRMFLGDPLSIETHLNNDWSLLLRNLKLKEDYLFDLLHYNHKIVNQVREENAQLFVND